MPDYGDESRPLAVPPPSSGAWHQPAPSKALAWWALGLSLVPAGVSWILSAVFACMVLVRCRDGRDHGRWPAIGALVVLAAWATLLATLFALYLAGEAERDSSGQVTSAGDVSVTDLRTGDCVDEPKTDRIVLTLHVQPCSAPHRAEVYAVFDLAGPFTTADDADRKAQGGCLKRFRDFVGRPRMRSDLEVIYYVPTTPEQFDADPSVACLAVSPEPVSETLRGSKR